MPAVAGASSRLALLASFEETLARSIGIFTSVLVFFASVIACAMVYNAARIALSERGRELASLRVLGFTRGEISALLLGEQALLTAARDSRSASGSGTSCARRSPAPTSGSCSACPSCSACGATSSRSS